MGIRNLNSTLRDSLLKEESFTYAHLVKFEKPLITETGRSLKRAQDYVYLSDGSTDIVFDDLSYPVNSSTANGFQTYIANKLISVGTVGETTQAKATSISINVSAAALSTSVTDIVTFTTTTITGTNDFVEEGFREGDILLITGGTNNTKEVRVDRFEDNNRKMVVSCTTNNLLAGTNQTVTLSFSNPEVESVLIDRTGGTSYARYLNRDVFIYKAHISPETGAIIGEPYLLFKGIIASGKLKEDPEKSSIITWNITSHWGDFNRVSGRLTADQSHRALDQDGNADPIAAIKPEYSTDLGFLHSEQAVNLVSTYQVKETKMKLKMKRNWLGMKSYKQIEYEVEVDREVDLRFNLSAKYLPVIYGVNKIDSIPVFVDTLASDSKKVFVAYAICEGQVGGLYDIFFDDTSSICIDANDSATRSVQTANSTVDLTCMGRADRGDTITPQSIAGGSVRRAQGTVANGSRKWEGAQTAEARYHQEYDYDVPEEGSSTSIGVTPQGKGITHEKGTRFDNPIDVRMQFHAGKSNQKADSMLLHNSGNFHIADKYYTGDEIYWGANHRLLDTAYLVAEYTIGEGETSIPSLDFVVRGKGIDCLNYDYSFAIDPDYSSTDVDPSTFNIGQTVTAYFSAAVSIGTVVIADKYNIIDIDGNNETRFRFTSNAAGGFTSFYIQDASNNKIHFVTTEYVGHAGTVPATMSEVISAGDVTDSSIGDGVDIDLSSSDSALQEAFNVSETFTILEDLGADIDLDALSAWIATMDNGVLVNVGETTVGSASLVGLTVVPMQSIKLGPLASATPGAYIGKEIEVTHTYPDNSIEVQRRKITAYSGHPHRIVAVDSTFVHAPIQGNTYKIFTSNNDIRVSTNPAMQLLDYLRSDRYGRGLDLDEDIDKESFLAAARACDERSNVTLLTDTAPTAGSEYKFTDSSGKTLWQGKVKTVSSAILVPAIDNPSSNDTQYSVEFEEVLGKLAHRWEDWKYFYPGELYYKEGRLHEHTGSAGLVAYSATNNRRSSLSLTNLDAGGSSLPLDFNYTIITGSITHGNRFTSDGDPLVKTCNSATSYTSGYSLYDADDIKYWRYLGWDAQNQRHVTRHQTNAVIDTSKSVFSNINSMLNHFNGILRYSNGKYSLDVKRQAQAPSTITLDGQAYSVEVIEDDDIIGTITVEDAGQKGTFNSLDVTINDPQNRFEGRSVMMFNSAYLKEDRMVPKKGSMGTPYVTNYFNARINAKQYLDSSRHGLKINFTMAPRGVLLRAGDVIRLNHSRFGWSQKMFRIENLNFNENCLVQVTAQEHSDVGYLIAPKSAQVLSPPTPPSGNMAVPLPVKPNTITATQNDRGGIELNWQNSDNFNAANYTVQIWKSGKDGSGNPINNIASAIHIGSTTASTYTDTVIDEGQTSRYYWLRYEVLRGTQTTQTQQKIVFSNYEPNNSVLSGSFVVGKTYNIIGLGSLNQAAWNTTAGTSSVTYAAGSSFVAATIGAPDYATASTGGVEGKSDGALDGITISLTNDNATVPLSSSDVLDFSNTSTIITVVQGSSSLIYDNSSPFANSSFRVTGVASSGVTASSSTPTSDGNTGVQYHGITALPGLTGTLTFTIVVKNSLGVETTFTKVQTFNKGERGGPGPRGDTGSGGPDGDTGSRGDTGPDGDTGAQGPDGDTGIRGATGPAGDTGVQGPEGDTGLRGSTGVAGSTGTQGPLGDTGPRGNTGVIGPDGNTGVQGPDGNTGAQGLTGNTGVQGPTGNTGVQGPDGDTGLRGNTGVQGPDGDTGSQGSTGPLGNTGAQGPDGATGLIGNTGLAGGTGVVGPSGQQGPAGSTGIAGNQSFAYYSTAPDNTLSTSPTINAWSSGSAYSQGNVVSYSSKVFVALQNHSGRSGVPSSDTTYWAEIFAGADNSSSTSDFTRLTPTVFINTGGYWLTVEGGQTNSQYRWYVDATVAGITNIKWTIAALEKASIDITQDDFQDPVLIKGQKGEQGVQGSSGATGPQGATGLEGAQGATGPDGNTGVQGPDGDTGSQGPTGPLGNTGVQGPDGNTGAQGPDGDTGLRGNTGVQGPDGDTGIRGNTGPLGNTGIQGPDGDTGAQGSTGVQGPDGDTGIRGNTGIQGPNGATGPIGDTGTRGNTGIQGPNGATGPEGDTGIRGNTGIQGPNGATGPEGDTGTRGNTGVTGVTGPDGPAGAAGNAIVFDTNGLETDANKYELIQSFRGSNDVLRNDVYWDVQTGKVYQWQNNSTTAATIPSGQSFQDLTTGSYGGFISADALTVSSETDGSKIAITSTKIEIYDGSTLRVLIGKLT